MAKTASRAIVVRENIRTQAPIIRVNVPRSAPAKQKRRRGRSRGGRGSGSTSIGRLATLGAVSYGLATLEKTDMWKQLPALPLIGKKGTALLALHFLKFGGGWAHDAQVALAVLIGRDLGESGTISGDMFT